MNEPNMGVGDLGRRLFRHVHTSPEATVFAPRRVLGAVDAARLRGLLSTRAGRSSDIAYRLERLLATAEIVLPTSVPADVITMGSRVLCTTPRARVEAELVYPWDASLEQGRVSVLSELGLAMLGNHIGARVEARNWLGTPVQWGLSQLVHQPR